jgi:hypothetical protein
MFGKTGVLAYFACEMSAAGSLGGWRPILLAASPDQFENQSALPLCRLERRKLRRANASSLHLPSALKATKGIEPGKISRRFGSD